jgi:hypothetical protein
VLKHATNHTQNRYPQAENQPHILALSVFSDTQIQRFKTKRAKIFPTPENYVF